MEETKITIEISEDLADTLRDNQATLEKLRTTLEAIHSTDVKTIHRLVTKAGYDMNRVRSWSYQGNSVVLDVFNEIPPQPTPVAPVQE